MTRIMVIGNAGGGKSTLCRALSTALSLPHHPIDNIQWQPGWIETPEAEYTLLHENFLKSEKWIIDGFGPWNSITQRMAAADTIIFVDHPLWVHFWWATKRQIKSIIFGRPDGPIGCPMLSVTFKLYKLIWQLHFETRPKLMNTINKHKNGRGIFHIKSPRELAKFQKKYC
ncbi:MAG: flagellar protein FlaR [Rhodospirillales bacterium]|jgi:adenylate kinase family enzyme|nr:flagellar protein FlaR [Rhodospirillales bacterium]